MVSPWARALSDASLLLSVASWKSKTTTRSYPDRSSVSFAFWVGVAVGALTVATRAVAAAGAAVAVGALAVVDVGIVAAGLILLVVPQAARLASAASAVSRTRLRMVLPVIPIRATDLKIRFV